MNVIDILQESKTTLIEQHIKNNNLLLESICYDLDNNQKIIVEGIYNEFRPLIEATLTPDQINKIFTDVETSATASGGNRSALGQGKDALVKANEIINKAGKWLQDTTPVKAFDQKFDNLKRKINTTFPDSKILDGISKLGILAQEHPKKTAAIVGILTAVASLAGGPLGGAIAGQVLRGSVELLKGEKLSTAIGKGIKTAVFGYLSGKAFEMLGNFAEGVRIKSIPFGPKNAGLEQISYGATKSLQGPGMEWSKTIQGVNVVVDPKIAGDIRDATEMLRLGGEEAVKGFDRLNDIATVIQTKEYRQGISATLKDAWEASKNNDSLLKAITATKEGLQAASQGAVAGAGVAADSKKESKNLTAQQLDTIFEWCNGSYSTQLNEGPLDALVGKVKQTGKNLTTKITADKLQKIWNKAGSPTDSNAVADLLRTAGVSDEILAPVYKSMKVKLNPQGSKDQVSTNTLDVNSIISAVETMRSRDLQSLNKHAEQLLGITQVATPQKTTTPPVAPKNTVKIANRGRGKPAVAPAAKPVVSV
jgi:hypothetical protein